MFFDIKGHHWPDPRCSLFEGCCIQNQKTDNTFILFNRRRVLNTITRALSVAGIVCCSFAGRGHGVKLNLCMNKLYNRFLKRCVRILLFIVFSTGAVAAQSQTSVQKGVLRIKFKASYAQKLEQSANGRSAFDARSTGLKQLNAVNASYKATSMKRVFPDAGRYEAKHRKHGLHLWYEVQIDSTAPASNARSAYQDIPEIEIAEPVHKKAILDYDQKKFKVLSATPGGSRTAAAAPLMNDPLLERQWHYNNHGQTNGKPGTDIDLFKAWSIQTGKKNVIVAVVDGGIQVDHPDLKNNIWTNDKEIAGNGIDDDNNGFIDDVHGFSFVDARGTIKPHPHGTHVAGTVAAENNNGIGVGGVAGGSGSGDGVRLMSCGVFKFLTPEVEIGGGFELAYVYAADNGAVILQNSWGYNEAGAYDQVVLDAIDYFIAEAGQDENGVQTGPMKGGIVIFSAGNDGYNGMKYPAYYEPTLAVAALDHTNAAANYTNYGDWVDVAAPGGEKGTNPDEEAVLSTYIGGEYAYFAGTSMAAPHVSGTAALIISQFGGPGFTPDIVRQRILSTTDGLYDDNTNYVGMLGAGRVNAFSALNNDNDFTGPQAIADLQAKPAGKTALTLQWTAPVDNGSRSASYYEVRYATTPITPANFAEATYVPDQPRPGPAGITETLTITGLQEGTNYYTAIRCYDMFRNVSPLSNVAQAVTQEVPAPIAPGFAISPATLEFQMKPGQPVMKKVYVTNTGTEDLTYNIQGNEGSLFEQELKMLSFSKRSGTVAPGKSDTLVLTFKPVERSLFLYEEFNVVTNDPANAKFPWVIFVTFSETDGKPVFTTTQLDLGKTVVGTNSERTISLKSRGSKPIQLIRYSFDNPDFSAYIGDFYPSGNFSPFSLSDYDSMTFKVFFRPSAAGKRTGTLTIRTSDPRYPLLTVSLSGEGLPAPVAAVDADTLSASLKTGESATRQFTLRNTGTTDMTFDVLTHGLPVEPKKVLVLSPDPGRVSVPFLFRPFKEISVDVAGNLSSLSLADLIPYDVVIVVNQRAWEADGVMEPYKIGDLLADYVDTGGKVIVNQFVDLGFEDNYEKTGLAGRFITAHYGPFMADVTTNVTPQKLGEVLMPGHPLLRDVHTLAFSGFLERVKLSPGAAGIARWSGGEWLLAANTNVVAMNFMPYGEYANDQLLKGDYQQLYRNAIHWLTGSDHLAVQPASGKIAPGQSVALEVKINSTGLPTGLYHSAVGMVTNDPAHGQVIVPVGIQVEGPSLTLAPAALDLAAHAGQQDTRDVTLRNNGTLAFTYTAAVTHIRPLSALIAESATPVAYSTGFSRFEVGRFTGLTDWYDSGKWYIDTVAAYSGKHHLRYTSSGIFNPMKLVSPVIATANGKSFCSAAIRIQGQGTDFAVAPLAAPSYFPVTTVTFAGDGSIRVDDYNEALETFETRPINESVPAGYFTVSIELDNVTSVFKVYFDQKLVYTGTAPFASINAIAFNSDNRSAGQSLYIDNVIVRQGAAELMPEFLQVSPLSGVLQPGEAATLTAHADAQGLKPGAYGAEIIATVGGGLAGGSVPVSFKVTGGASVMDVSHDYIGAVADYNATAVRFFEISNFGGEPFEFTVDAPQETASWLSIEPASGIVAPNSIVTIKVKYAAQVLTPGYYNSVLSVTSNAANRQSHVISTSLNVLEPARVYFGPQSIQLELIGGKQAVVPVSFANGGYSALQMAFEKSNQDWVKIEAGTHTLQPQTSGFLKPVTISAVGLNAGVYQETLHIQTSDPDNATISVRIQLTVVAPAALQLSTDTLRAAVAPGGQTAKDISIANAGAIDLQYVISSQHIDNTTPFHNGPDTFGYTFVKTGEPGGPAFVWNDIKDTGVPIALGEFDSLTVTLPFVFPFYGVLQQQVKITSDGFLAFNTLGMPTRQPDDRSLIKQSEPNNFIAAHWDDLDPRLTGTIYYKKEADKFTVQYTDITFNTWGYPSVPELRNTFQIVLHADGSIAFHYLDIMNYASQLVGIENADGTDGLIVKDTYDWPSPDSATFLIVPTVPWLNADMQSASITAGLENQVDLTFDAQDLDEGIYHTTLYVTSNDPKNPVTRIPVKFDTRVEELATGTIKEEAKETLSLYPVPAKERLNIKLTRKATHKVDLIIRNAMGQAIFEKEVDQSKISAYALDLDPLHLSPGVYSLQLVSQDGWTTAKSFVKQ